MSFLSLPVLVLLGWCIGGLLWWDYRKHVISPAQRPWTVAGFGMLALAMVIALVAVPANAMEQAVRLLLLAEAGFGIATLSRKGSHRDG